jgi:hypothetical protein
VSETVLIALAAVVTAIVVALTVLLYRLSAATASLLRFVMEQQQEANKRLLTYGLAGQSQAGSLAAAQRIMQEPVLQSPVPSIPEELDDPGTIEPSFTVFPFGGPPAFDIASDRNEGKE